MHEIKTLSDFFRQSQTQYRIFDMGRGIRKLPQDLFEQFEAGKQPYPYPLQQHAWLGIVGWNRENREEQFIWFLKFPLDETGSLILATRDDFIARLMQTLGHNIQAVREGNELQDGMNESPYGFKPKESAMAAFHAKATSALGQPPSRFYDHAKGYFDGTPGYDQWAFVGIQGIADVAARLEQDDNQQRLVKALPKLPAAALSALCGFLESETLDTPLAEAIQKRLQLELEKKETDIQLIAALLRSFAGSKGKGIRQAVIREVLGSPHSRDITILAAIAARNWEVLTDETIARDYVEALAANNLGQEAFTQVMADLLYIPGMRASLLSQLRNPERSETLSRAVGAMFNVQL